MGRDRASGRPTTVVPPQTSAAPPRAAQQPSNKPVYQDKLGRIRAAVWANNGESGVWYSVVFSRSYKDGDAWKRSDKFSRDDLPLVMKLADRVHTWIFEQQSSMAEPP